MKTPFPSIKKLLTLTFALSCAHAAWAAPIVTWGPSSAYVGGNTNAAGLSAGVVPFSDTVARNPGPTYPNGQPSGTYYGGASAQNVGGITVWRVLNGASPVLDALNFGATLNNSETATGVFLWKQADFLNGLNTGNITLDSSNAFSASLNVSGSSTTGTARWLVQSAGSYYLSASFALTTTATSYSRGNPTSTQWYNYDPVTSMTTVGSEWPIPTFSNITAVGVWIESKYVGGTSATSEGRIYDFTAAAIPEPGTMGLLALGGIFVSFMVRRRRVSK